MYQKSTFTNLEMAGFEDDVRASDVEVDESKESHLALKKEARVEAVGTKNRGVQRKRPQTVVRRSDRSFRHQDTNR